MCLKAMGAPGLPAGFPEEGRHGMGSLATRQRDSVAPSVPIPCGHAPLWTTHTTPHINQPCLDLATGHLPDPTISLLFSWDSSANVLGRGLSCP